MGSELIPLINRVQSALASLGHDPLRLPRIVVIGSQSTGKSSVLENIVGRDFLPRGPDVVTRRPLVLQLHTLASGASAPAHSPRAGDADTYASLPAVLDEPAEYAEFEHKPGEIFTDFGLVRREIELETSRALGGGASKKVCSTPIVLSIHAPDVVNLTLVDLPGITKVPVGDQPRDIEEQVRALALEHIQNPHAIILAVSAANVDLANSESLKLARQVDPEGLRTVGVVTKLDLMDSGTSAIDALYGRVVPLRLGYVGVVSRSQRDTQQGKGIRDSLRAEEEFFRGHEAYRAFAARCGTPYLTKTLNKLLVQSIREQTPSIRKKLAALAGGAADELATFGKPVSFESDAEPLKLLLQLLTDFATSFNRSIEGTMRVQQAELTGGARIHYVFNDLFARTLEQTDPCGGLSLSEIRTAIRNSAGPRSMLFIPDLAFELIVKRQIARLADPAQRCVDLVFEELMRVAAMAEAQDVKRFPALSARIMQETTALLREGLAPAKRAVEELINIELALINTGHPDFIGAARAIEVIERHRRTKEEGDRRAAAAAGASATIGADGRAAANGAAGRGDEGGKLRQLTSLMGIFGGWQTTPVQAGGVAKVDMLSTMDQRVGEMTEKEQMEVELLRALIISYFNIVRKHVADLVPKAIMYHMVNRSRDQLQSRLVSALYRSDGLAEVLTEEDSTAAERDRCRHQLEVYQRALRILDDVLL